MRPPGSLLIALVLPLLAPLPIYGSTRDLGQVIELEPPSSCRGTCHTLEVTCPGVREAARAVLRVREARRSAGVDRGTVYLATGGGGQGFWADTYGRPAAKAIKKLRRKGFRTIEVSWEDLWLDAAPDLREGAHRLACRPATVAQWIHDRLHSGNSFCASGNSGGAAQVTYMLSHYGLGEILDAVVASGGPPLSRMDLGCLGPQDPGLPPLVYGPSAKSLIDRSLGSFDAAGPCSSELESFRSVLEAASIASGPLETYRFDTTSVWLVFGADDNGSAVGQGILFYERLVAAGAPAVGMRVVANTPHAVPSANKGARRIRHLLLDHCRPSE